MQLELFYIQPKKKCSSCDITKDLNEYYKDSRTKKAAQPCKKCKDKIHLEWRKKNKEKSNFYALKSYRKHREKKLIYYRERYKKNRKKMISESVKNNAKKRKTDLFFRFKDNLRNVIKNSINKKKLKKNSKTKDILGCEMDFFYNYFESKFENGMSWENKDKWHIDHKIPLAAASTEFEVIALNHYTNLQPLWADDNLKKSDKYNIEDFKKYMDWYRKNIKNDRRPL